MDQTSLTKTFEFSASHRYWIPTWSVDENMRTFGKCAYPNGHGHNYLLEVTVTGPIDAVTGMVINLVDVKATVEDVLVEFDHRHLNEDMDYFDGRIPTTENLAITLWQLISDRLLGEARLARVRLHEDEDLYVEYYGGSDAPN
ncbi:6-carboxytetrahydropterin synthase [Dehalococcoidia bacterium]|nr:6-carboxytetrahydropterin synthase [Dehalococcoidia bacterium]